MINSLRSCLPNEVNFIINTLLLYCSDHHKGKRLKLERCPHLLDILMLHAGCPKLEVIYYFLILYNLYNIIYSGFKTLRKMENQFKPVINGILGTQVR